MSLPPELQAIYDRQSPEEKAKLRALLADPDEPVTLCCKTDSQGNEVCIAVDSASECCVSCSVKTCYNGQTNIDGSATCNDDEE